MPFCVTAPVVCTGDQAKILTSASHAAPSVLSGLTIDTHIGLTCVRTDRVIEVIVNPF